jgi:hypothetical protein
VVIGELLSVSGERLIRSLVAEHHRARRRWARPELGTSVTGRFGSPPARLGSRRVTESRRLKHPVPDSLLAGIGDVTVSFALLESEIQTLAGSQIQDNQRIGQLVTAELSFRNLRALTMSLYRERHGQDADYDELRELMRRARKLERLRNDITHSVWGAGEKRGTVTRIKTTAKESQGLRFSFEKVSRDDLNTVAEQIQGLASDIQLFWVRLIEEGKAINDPSVRLW